MKELRTCEICGKEFFAARRDSKTCSYECRYKLNNQKKREKRSQERTYKTCPVCGTEFLATRKNQMYCSPECARNARRSYQKRFKLQKQSVTKTSSFDDAPVASKYTYCKVCGGKIKSTYRYIDLDCCSPKCYNEYMRKEKAFMYLGAKPELAKDFSLEKATKAREEDEDGGRISKDEFIKLVTARKALNEKIKQENKEEREYKLYIHDNKINYAPLEGKTTEQQRRLRSEHINLEGRRI